MRKPTYYERLMAVARRRRLRALKLRAAGKTYEQIGAALGITRQGAHALIRSTKPEGADA